MTIRKLGMACAAVGAAFLLASCPAPPPAGDVFTIAVIPDTQNMIDYRHQTAERFPFDASAQFMAQMQYVADHAVSAGGDIAFATAVGDVWEHQSLVIDPIHAQEGFNAVANPYFAGTSTPTPQTQAVELPTARAGYALLAAKLPFGVAPGNHDHDAMWPASHFPAMTPAEMAAFREKNPNVNVAERPDILGMLHIGGLDNFRSVFGADSPLFKDKPWYVASFRGGGDSAQTFTAGGYTFLHIALEMAADDEVLAWAKSVLDAHPGLPTIVTTHDYLDTKGERRANPIIDLKAVDARHNNAEDLWTKFVSQNDQIFLVLCGHHHGQSRRMDLNSKGHQVHQILADYQDRGQSALDAGVPQLRDRAVPIGDAWFRLMTFDTRGAAPVVKVRTYSPHYKAYSTDAPNYVAWYKAFEDPELSDADYMREDDFSLELADFMARFGKPK